MDGKEFWSACGVLRTGEKMKITDVRINGMVNPVGFLMGEIRVAWKVRNTKEKRQKKARVEAAMSEEFSELLYEIEGEKLDSTAVVLPIRTEPRTRYFVRVFVEGEAGEHAVSEPAFFETGKQEESWIGKWITTRERDSLHPTFEKVFKVEKEVESARLYISGLGMFYACLNGKKIGQEVLTPYYSNYHEEIQYMTYDVTKQICKRTKLTVSLGNGWYKGAYGHAGQKNNYGSTFQMIAELHLRYKDGIEEVIGTDESWEYFASDVESDSIYDGEVLDRMIWEKRQNSHRQAVLTTAEGRLTARYSLPVLEMEERKVREVIQTPSGETVLDFGQNFTGYVVFKAALPKRTKIVLDYGEILQDGDFYNANYREARSQFTYVSNGKKEEVRPHFTYFGFRYVRVTGWPGEVKKTDFVGKVLYSWMTQTGKIESGHAGVNQMVSNALWGLKSNAVDFPTDCPQKDARLGWTGDAQIFCKTANFLMDNAAYSNKFLHDLRTVQKSSDGKVPGVIPVFARGEMIVSSVWSDIATFLPSVLYEHYADKSALRQYYPMMKEWVDWITQKDRERGERNLYDFEHQIGDWQAKDGRDGQSMESGTDEYFISSCYYLMSVEKTKKAADILGFSEDAASYGELYQKIYQAILDEYFTRNGRLAVDTQTGYLVALYAGVYVDREKLIRELKERLFKDCYQMRGGMIGSYLLCRMLAEHEMEEEAFYFLLQKEYPGWMHCIELGATTFWETWDAVLDNGEISGTKRNSLNHYVYGAVVEYLFQNVAGLHAVEPGFRKARIVPLVSRKIRSLKMSYDSACGLYRCEWEIQKNGKLKVEVEVPFGCTAQICLPFSGGDVKEVDSGVYTYEYLPDRDLKQRYTKKTLFREMLKDEEALQIIAKASPRLLQAVATGKKDYLYETLQTLRRLTFAGFTEEELDQLEAGILSLED